MKRDFDPVRCHIPPSSASAGGATVVVTEISVVGSAGVEAADPEVPSLIRITGRLHCAHGLEHPQPSHGGVFLKSNPAGSAVETES